jgi:hypothetical protein
MIKLKNKINNNKEFRKRKEKSHHSWEWDKTFQITGRVAANSVIRRGNSSAEGRGTRSGAA